MMDCIVHPICCTSQKCQIEAIASVRGPYESTSDQVKVYYLAVLSQYFILATHIWLGLFDKYTPA
jgi:hypothetical protein